MKLLERQISGGDVLYIGLSSIIGIFFHSVPMFFLIAAVSTLISMVVFPIKQLIRGFLVLVLVVIVAAMAYNHQLGTMHGVMMCLVLAGATYIFFDSFRTRT